MTPASRTSESYYWDSDVFLSYINQDLPDRLMVIDELLKDAADGKCRIYADATAKRKDCTSRKTRSHLPELADSIIES